jgi:hypothetical protein
VDENDREESKQNDLLLLLGQSSSEISCEEGLRLSRNRTKRERKVRHFLPVSVSSCCHRCLSRFARCIKGKLARGV